MSKVVEFKYCTQLKQFHYLQKPYLRTVRTLCDNAKKQIPPSYPTYRSSSPTVSSTGISPPAPRTSLHARASRCGSMDASSRTSGLENTSLVPASINIPLSFITMVLLAYSATTPMSWLIRIIVFPASFNIFIRDRNLFRCPRSCPVVGSSSTMALPEDQNIHIHFFCQKAQAVRMV